jgi:transposase
MLDQSIRIAILRLHNEGHGSRTIAALVGASRHGVRRVIASQREDVAYLKRSEKAEGHREQILALLKACKGNLVRVHEEITAQGAVLSYQGLTAFCRRHGITAPPQAPAGSYDFAPAREMQHDTSPHRAEIAGVMCRIQTASLVLCYSRLMYFQCYPTFTRFDCKRFLTSSLSYVSGACKICMIDNTHVVVLSGTGKDMVPVPEMAAFAARYGFTFRAHEKGHANRSARVERPFHFFENNFLAGRKFDSWEHLNQEAIAWCDKVNSAHNRHLGASRRTLFDNEHPMLTPLPVWIPEVYQLHHRVVDLQGYVQVTKTRYSAPYQYIGRRVEVRESDSRIDIYDGPRKIASHPRQIGNGLPRVTEPKHRPPRGEGHRANRAHDTGEVELLRRAPQLRDYVVAHKGRPGAGVRFIRGLLRLLRDYPREAVLAAAAVAHNFGLYDIARLERMVLKRIAQEYFVLPAPPEDEEYNE